MGVIADRTPRLRRYAEAVLAEPQPTPVLGIDDTHRGKPRWERCAATGRRCGSSREKPDSSTWPGIRACSGNAIFAKCAHMR